MQNCLILDLKAPLMSFGSTRRAHRGPTDVLPARSMVTGLLGNALGWENQRDREKLERLQERLVTASRLNQPLSPQNFLRDYQTAQISTQDRAWTTSGIPVRRTSSPNSLVPPHVKLQDYLADAHATVSVRFHQEEAPTAEDLAEALMHPARPLFIGRKNCVPAGYILQDLVESQSAVTALMNTPLPQSASGLIRMRWESTEETPGIEPQREYPYPGKIDWRTHLESGWIWIREALVTPEVFWNRETEA